MKKLQQMLAEKEELRQYLFVRGFLLTNKAGIKSEEYPFFGQWTEKSIGGGT